jgi:hypothetical protein
MTDVITNSSTSVFCVYESQNINTIKNLVNSILAISGDYTFDDLFNIKFSLTDDGEDFIKAKGKDENNLTQTELDVLESKFYEWADWDSVKFYSGIEVTVKPGIDSLKVEKAAQLISQIDNIFDLDYSYD